MSDRYKMHQVVPAHAVAFDAWMVAKIGQMLHQVVVDLRSGIGLTHNEVSVSQIPPRDLTLSR